MSKYSIALPERWVGRMAITRGQVSPPTTTGICSEQRYWAAPDRVAAVGAGLCSKLRRTKIFVPAAITFPGVQLSGTTSKGAKVAFTYSGHGTLTLNSLTASANFSVNTSGIPANACNLNGSTSMATGKSCYFTSVFTPHHQRIIVRRCGCDLYGRSGQLVADAATER